MDSYVETQNKVALAAQKAGLRVVYEPGRHLGVKMPSGTWVWFARHGVEFGEGITDEDKKILETLKAATT